MSERSVALLRGINVGGNRKLSMPALAEAFESAGCARVTTYIQSGNVAFEPPPAATCPPAGLVAHLEAAVDAAAGFPVPIVLRTGTELERIVEALPYPADDPTKVHVAFLTVVPTAEAVEAFGRTAEASEAFVWEELNVYLHLPAGIGRSKLAVGLAKLQVPVTVRNWRTVTKLLDLARA